MNDHEQPAGGNEDEDALAARLEAHLAGVTNEELRGLSILALTADQSATHMRLYGELNGTIECGRLAAICGNELRLRSFRAILDGVPEHVQNRLRRTDTEPLKAFLALITQEREATPDRLTDDEFLVLEGYASFVLTELGRRGALTPIPGVHHDC